MLFPVGSFSYTPCAVLCGEFVLDTLCYFMCGNCLLCDEILTCPMLLFYVGSFSYMPHAVLCGEFLLHTPCCFMGEISLTRPLLFYVGRFSYTVHAVLCGEFLLHGPCCFMWRISLPHSVLFYVGVSLRLQVLIFMQEVSFPCPMLFDIRNLSYTPYTSLCGEIF